MLTWTLPQTLDDPSISISRQNRDESPFRGRNPSRATPPRRVQAVRQGQQRCQGQCAGVVMDDVAVPRANECIAWLFGSLSPCCGDSVFLVRQCAVISGFLCCVREFSKQIFLCLWTGGFEVRNVKREKSADRFVFVFMVCCGCFGWRKLIVVVFG